MTATATAPVKAKKKRAVNLTLNDAHAAQQRQSGLSRQQTAEACVEYWNEVLAAEGSFADEHSTL